MNNLELALIPRRPARRDNTGERVIVTGWRGGEQVSAVSVADQRIMVQEHVGIVIRDRRSLTSRCRRRGDLIVSWWHYPA
ncbi:hypothetical protein BZM27_53440 [Paraburkholderia steynii]|uniref:Uncharacterized protein n=1 Tax=Paraburkholderia steynii TaxID=1245441 RepID=A0A4R0XA66_9BURK|nr:hypothetical protein BZM27_53440 [Paraburkholderia steynii]